jgi:hypothetical protein
MATTTLRYVKSAAPAAAIGGQTPADVAALVLAYNRLEARLEALLTKMDADAGITDTNYAATINGTEPNALITLVAIQ